MLHYLLPKLNVIILTENQLCYPKERQTLITFLLRIEVQIRDLGTTMTNQNSIHEESKTRLYPGNASPILSKTLKINIYKSITLPVGLYGWETGSATLGE
jgi:hypothetical protein